MEKPETSALSDDGAGQSDRGEQAPGQARRTLAPVLDEIRAALRALDVPEKLLTVRVVDSPEAMYDQSAEGVVADDEDQLTGLTALLHRVTTTMRATLAIEAQNFDDQTRETHLLDYDRISAHTADLFVLTRQPAPDCRPVSVEFVRDQLAGNLARVGEEARWMLDQLSGLITYSTREFAAGGVTGRVDEHVPAPLFAARTTLSAAYSSLLLAYAEVALPDSIDTDEGEVLAETLGQLQQTSRALIQYGMRRGMLSVSTDESGRRVYRVVDDIVAAAAGTAGGTAGASEPDGE